MLSKDTEKVGVSKKMDRVIEIIKVIKEQEDLFTEFDEKIFSMKNN